MSRDDDVTLDDCIVVKRLKNSLLVQYEGEEIIIPFSQICADSDFDEDSEPDDSGTLVIPLWLADDRGVA
jgi:hypothetical protein